MLPRVLCVLQSDSTAVLRTANEEREFLRSVNEGVVANQVEYVRQLEAAKKQMGAKDAAIADLEEQV